MKQNTATITTPRKGVTRSKNATLNADGRPAFERSNKTALFLLGVGRFFGEKSYYPEEESRFCDLVAKVTKSDPQWVADFLKWLRNDANIRTAAIVGAAEYVRAGGPNGRAVVKSVIVRADEPAEMLAYWMKNYGKRIPQPIKRGIADSARNLYTERNFAKWNGSNAVQMADVVELTHPKPNDSTQSDLFRFMIESRHGRGTFEDKSLTSLRFRSWCSSREDYLAELKRGNPTISWENVSSAGKGSMTAEQWLEVYPYMGYMAKLRNLRNLDVAGVPVREKRKIGEWLADPANVAKSRQLPMRFYSAYLSIHDDVWKSYLSEALDHSLANVPKVRGNWLVMVDASGSMTWGTSSYSKLAYYDAASVFGVAFAKANNADLRTYSISNSPVLPIEGMNTLRAVNQLKKPSYYFGGGTYTSQCLKSAFDAGNYDGVLLLTDEQYNDYNYLGDPSKSVPVDIPLYTFNLVGYRSGSEMGMNRITVGGLSDSAFSMIAAVESAKAKWPWE